MALYETLGVDKTATERDIKKAYRAKARQTHPDKGGNAEEFAEVAKAFEVLSDPARRLLYDRTGQETETPIEIEVRGVLMSLFAQALASEEDIEVTAFVRNCLSNRLTGIPAEIKKVEALRAKVEQKRDKITCKSTNLVHLIIDGELMTLAAQLDQLERQAEIGRQCIIALDDYSEEWEAPPPPSFQTFDFQRESPFANATVFTL